MTPQPGEESSALDRLIPLLESNSLPRGIELFQLPNGTVELWTAFDALLAGTGNADSICDRFENIASMVLKHL